MSLYFKLLLILLTLIYIVSPFDFLPDIIPFFGRGDDIFLLFMLIYYLITGRLPRFFNFRRPMSGGFSRSSSQQSSDSSNHAGKEKEKKRQESRSKSRTDETFKKSERKSWNPYEILGVKPGAGPEEIQAAYRRAVQKYHPDKVSHLGEEFQELARKKFIEIQKAYEELKVKP
jgi:hypothetical protein